MHIVQFFSILFRFCHEFVHQAIELTPVERFDDCIVDLQGNLVFQGFPVLRARKHGPLHIQLYPNSLSLP